VINELFIHVTTSEISIALLEDKKLVELNKEKRELKFSVGDIYLGRVKKIMPGLNAAFVDVGYEKDAFLHYHDLGPQFRSLNKYLYSFIDKKGKPPVLSRFKLEPDIDKNGLINNVLNQGQKILVQITKEPISTKGPRLTSEISIAGRNLVLIPFSNKVSISQKISSSEERARLKNIIDSIKPKNFGVIIRTVAENKRVAELDEELRSLVKKWESAFNKGQFKKIPQLFISEVDRTVAILRDLLNPSFTNIYVDDESVFREIKDYIAKIAPEKEKIVKLYNGKDSLFEKYGIEKQIKSLFGKTVSFKQGAYLIIEHTEALHVIDVNSGNRSKSSNTQENNALEINLAAAEEIARQLRLRDMGGIIVVDFIDMKSNENKQKVYEKMKEVMQNDRTKHNILPLTKFGLMQITRQRVRPVMSINVYEKCPSCKGSGEVPSTSLFTDEIENKLGLIINKNKHLFVILQVHPYVAAYIKKGLFSLRFKWMLKFRCYIKVKAMASYAYLEYRFLDINKNSLSTDEYIIEENIE